MKKDHLKLDVIYKHYDVMRKDFYIISSWFFFRQYYTVLKNDKYNKYILPTIFIMYLICWGYVLFFTLKTLPIEKIIWITSIITEDFNVTTYKEISNIDENK